MLRRRINETIRAGLADEGVLAGETLEIDTLVDMRLTRAQRRDPRNYRVGDVALFHEDFHRYRIAAGDACEVTAVEGDLVRLAHPSGEPRHFDPSGRLAYGLGLYETVPISIQAGDRIRWTRNDHARALLNGGEATILAIASDTLEIRTDDDRLLTLSHDDPQLRHIAHAYATTVHAAQGSTRDRVIAVLDSGHGVLSDQATFYVEISRARDQAIVLTDNIEQLVETLEDHTGETLTALEAIGEEPDPLHDIGRQVRANMRAPGSPLAKGVPPDPARREATRWAAALDEWCEQRDRHQEAAARAGTHPSQHPGHDELMGRCYEKQVAPAPTERAVLLRRQPRPMEIVRWMERELVVSEGDLAGQGFVVRDFQRKFIRGFLRNTESVDDGARQRQDHAVRGAGGGVHRRTFDDPARAGGGDRGVS